MAITTPSRLMGGITGPISSKVAFRLDGLYNRRDGYLLDVVSGEELVEPRPLAGARQAADRAQ